MLRAIELGIPVSASVFSPLTPRAVSTLLCTASHGFAEAVVAADGVHAALRAAESHPKEERLSARVAGVIRLLAVSDETKACSAAALDPTLTSAV